MSGCQLLWAIINGVPVWCQQEEGHTPPCDWPDVPNDSRLRVDMNTWPNTHMFRIRAGEPPILEERR